MLLRESSGGRGSEFLGVVGFACLDRSRMASRGADQSKAPCGARRKRHIVWGFGGKAFGSITESSGVAVVDTEVDGLSGSEVLAWPRSLGFPTPSKILLSID